MDNKSFEESDLLSIHPTGPRPVLDTGLIITRSVLTNESVGVIKELKAQGEQTFVESPQSVERIVQLCSEKENDPRRLETTTGVIIADDGENMAISVFPPSPLVHEIDFKQEKVKRDLWLKWREKERAK